MTRNMSPHLVAEARRLGIDQAALAAITGTGAGNRVTLADVRAAAPRRQGPRAATVTRPTPVMEPLRDPWGGVDGPAVMIDVFSANPLVDFVMATAGPPPGRATPPTFFNSGDLPPLTASGVDPEVLVRIGWRLRHTAALARDPAVVLGLLELGRDVPADEPGVVSPEGNRAFEEYRLRVRTWALSRPTEEPLTDADFTGLFGGETP